ncbi:glycosyltransferase family 4 protein [Nonomuraea fuscirosea]|uniref:glycosyltransferase family 4 protein n=1 Tax=Nonomuraea fuscirosea TaxID=1291556 RepID=UPI0034376B67
MTAIATALDLPAGSPGGSVELLYDLYAGSTPLIPARAFMLRGDHPPPPPIVTLQAKERCLAGPGFWAYANALTVQLNTALDCSRIALLHLQHLTFGATPALIRALPRCPSIALVHGTDLLFASNNDTQHQVLDQAIRFATKIVIPTPAMAPQLLRLAPHLDPTKIEHIPWGIPDQLLNRPPGRDRPNRTGAFRLLYAGRLTAEKGLLNLAEACTRNRDTVLSIAAPADQYSAIAPLLQELRCPHHYLGWLDRRTLWSCFTDHDALAVPSTVLEAFGLVALEAQASGLPVIYQPVPGLIDVLTDTALPTDFTDPTALRTTLGRLRRDPTMLADLRTAGYANARRFPISATATALTALGNQIA